MEIHEAPEVYQRLVHYDELKEVQVRLTVSTFRGVEYLSLRKYYLDFFTEEWSPSKEGVTIPIDFSNSRELFAGLVEILSLAESKQVIEENFGDLIEGIYK
jgi:hypothetical protein|tara:strand:+ start:250 stop:552 length:303 start_codon:yes stop_codon:yes gene_type:complete